MDFARVDSTLGLDVATDPPVASSMGRATDPEWLTFYSPGRSPGCCTQMNRPLIIYPGCHGQRRGVRRRAVGRAFITHRRCWLAAWIDARQICQCRTHADQAAPPRTRPTARRRTPRRWPWHPRLRHVCKNQRTAPGTCGAGSCPVTPSRRSGIAAGSSWNCTPACSPRRSSRPSNSSILVAPLAVHPSKFTCLP